MHIFVVDTIDFFFCSLKPTIDSGVGFNLRLPIKKQFFLLSETREMSFPLGSCNIGPLDLQLIQKHREFFLPNNTIVNTFSDNSGWQVSRSGRWEMGSFCWRSENRSSWFLVYQMDNDLWSGDLRVFGSSHVELISYNHEILCVSEFCLQSLQKRSKRSLDRL